MKLYDLSYTDNLIERYSALHNLPGFVLLESSDHHYGRYDILSAYHYKEKVICPNSLCLDHEINELMGLLPQMPPVNALPFQGGVIGFVSYDFGMKYSGTPFLGQELVRNFPLLHLRWYDWAIIVDHFIKKVFLFSRDYQASTAKIVQEVLGLFNAHTKKSRNSVTVGEFQPLISKRAYRLGFDSIYQSLLSGRAYQVNYTQPFISEYEGNAWDMYQIIRAQNPVPFSAFLNTQNDHIMSFSPERFILFDKGRVLTSPIKGSVKRAHNKDKDAQLKRSLRECTKNRAENVMIVDLLRNDLGRFAKTGSVKVKNLFELQSFKSVHHLVSHIEALYDTSDHPLELLLKCFPGGSITGAPKLEAMKIISEQEPYLRGIYCGTLFYLSFHGRLDSNIAIRTLIATQENQLILQAGGGVVIDSLCESEYQECLIKLAGIREALSSH